MGCLSFTQSDSVSGQLELIRPHLEGSIPQNKRLYVQQFYGQVSPTRHLPPATFHPPPSTQTGTFHPPPSTRHTTPHTLHPTPHYGASGNTESSLPHKPDANRATVRPTRHPAPGLLGRQTCAYPPSQEPDANRASIPWLKRCQQMAQKDVSADASPLCLLWEW